jgi:hypothetical protein
MDDTKPHRQHIIICPFCQTAQAVNIEQSPEESSPPLESITCINEKCERTFDLEFAGRVVGGPWLV